MTIVDFINSTVSLQYADYINTAFYSTNVAYWLANVWKLYQDKVVDGFIWHHVIFYIVWCLWDVIFLVLAQQHWAIVAQVLVLTLQVTYAAMYLYFRLIRKYKSVPML